MPTHASDVQMVAQSWLARLTNARRGPAGPPDGEPTAAATDGEHAAEQTAEPAPAPASEPRPPRQPHVLVVGGGVAGLQMARMLDAGGVRVTLAEASDRLGGKVRAHVVGGIALDAGAESFATRRGTIAALATELGLADKLVTPAGAGAWLQPRTGPAVPLPRAGLLGIPSVPLARDVIRVIGLRGALRAQLDSLMPGRVGSTDHSLGTLVRKRMGAAVLDRLVTPVASAIHSRHPDELDVDIVAPRVRAAVLREGSLAKAVLTVRSSAPAGSAVQGLSGGLFQIAEALERAVTGRIEIRRNTRVSGIALADAGQQLVTFRDGSKHLFDAVVLAAAIETTRVDATPTDVTPIDAGPAAAALHEAPRGLRGEASITLATLVLDAPALDVAPRGSGVIVAAGAPGIRAKALTHATAKWAWLREAAAGKHVVRLSYESAPATDAELSELARRDAAALLGVALAPADVIAFGRTTWPGASSGDSPSRHGMGPTSAPGVSTPFGIVHIGERVAGTGLQAIIAHATKAAEKLIHDLADQPGLRLV